MNAGEVCCKLPLLKTAAPLVLLQKDLPMLVVKKKTFYLTRSEETDAIACLVCHASSVQRSRCCRCPKQAFMIKQSGVREASENCF